MSYSFGLRAASIAALMAAAAAKMGEVVQSQPAHVADSDAALHTLQLHAEKVGEPPAGKVLSVSVSGHCSVQMQPDGKTYGQLLHTSTTVSVGLADKAEGE